MWARFTGDDADHRFVLSSLWPFFWAATRPNRSMPRPPAKINLKKCCQMWALLTSVTPDGEGDSTFVLCSSRPLFWARARPDRCMLSGTKGKLKKCLSRPCIFTMAGIGLFYHWEIRISVKSPKVNWSRPDEVWIKYTTTDIDYRIWSRKRKDDI